MAEAFIGEIRMFAGTYAPAGWALCDGQILSIQQYTALFALLGTTYGGNGTTTFGLPDLRGRFALHPGMGPGLSPHHLGEPGGCENVVLNQNQMPSHGHAVILHASATGDQSTPAGHVPAPSSDGYTIYASAPDPTTMHAGMATAAPVGGNQPHTNVPPYQCVNFIIALEGIFPPRP